MKPGLVSASVREKARREVFEIPLAHEEGIECNILAS